MKILPSDRPWFRLSFSVRTLTILVTSVCVYFGAWEATKRHGVRPSAEVIAEIEATQGPIPASITSPDEASPLPFIVERTVYGDFHATRFYRLWFFGLTWELTSWVEN